MIKSSVTILVDIKTFNAMQAFYQNQIVPHCENYVVFMAKGDKVVIKGFSNKREETFKVYFSGENALNEARIWDKDAKIKVPKAIIKAEWLFIGDQIGSDEVGVGDFFGPTIVVAAFVSASKIPELIALGIKDSKKLNEEKIRHIAPLLMDILPYHVLTLSNKKLNSMMEAGSKKLALEAMMHNECHLRVLKKIKMNDVPIYIDEFLKEPIYRRYLGDKIVAPNLHFKQKGESYYPAIAASSIIARFHFLKYMDELSKEHNCLFPFGAGMAVDQFATSFLQTHTISELKDLIKAQFANYRNLVK